MAGRRAAGLSLWSPGNDWLADDDTEVSIAFLPSKLWLIGLGNLGQAYLWLLTCLQYYRPEDVEFVLQDFDIIAESNYSTSVLTSGLSIGRLKTRAVAEWLENRGFHTRLVEQHFGEWQQRSPHDPGIALCGVDNTLARASLEKAGFGLVVEAGLGAGTEAFRNFSVHTFPSPLIAADIWGRNEASNRTDALSKPAYQPDKHPDLDICGLVQLASRTIGVPFVSVTAGALVIAEILRRLNGGPAFAVVSGSLATLEDIETFETQWMPYEFGHVAVFSQQERGNRIASRQEGLVTCPE